MKKVGKKKIRVESEIEREKFRLNSSFCPLTFAKL